MERRRSRRYRLSASAYFCWEGSDSVLREATGSIRDISVTGLFIVSDTVPGCGAQAEFNVYFPSPKRDGAAVQMHGEGRVIRVNVQDAMITGFAAEVILQTAPSSDTTILSFNEVQ